jgi:hypothetical protein
MPPKASVFAQTCTDSAGQEITSAFSVSDTGVTPMTFADELDEKGNLAIEFDSKPGIPAGSQQTAPCHARIFFGPNTKNKTAVPSASSHMTVPRAEFGDPDNFNDPLTARARDFRKLAEVFGPLGKAPETIATHLSEMIDKKKVPTLSGVAKKPKTAKARIKDDMELGWKPHTKSTFTPSAGVKLYAKDDVETGQMTFSVPLFVARTTGDVASDLDRLRSGSTLHEYQTKNEKMMPNPRFMMQSPYTNETVHWTVVFKPLQYDSVCLYCAANFVPKCYMISVTYDRVIASIFLNHLVVYAIVGGGGAQAIPECAPMSAAQQALVDKIFYGGGEVDESKVGAELGDGELVEACDESLIMGDDLEGPPPTKRIKIEDE